MSNAQIFKKLFKFLIYELSTVVGDDSTRNTKVGNDVLQYKFLYIELWFKPRVQPQST